MPRSHKRTAPQLTSMQQSINDTIDSIADTLTDDYTTLIKRAITTQLHNAVQNNKFDSVQYNDICSTLVKQICRTNTKRTRQYSRSLIQLNELTNKRCKAATVSAQHVHTDSQYAIAHLIPVCHFIDLYDIVALRQVNKQWRAVCQQQAAWLYIALNTQDIIHRLKQKTITNEKYLNKLQSIPHNSMSLLLYINMSTELDKQNSTRVCEILQHVAPNIRSVLQVKYVDAALNWRYLVHFGSKHRVTRINPSLIPCTPECVTSAAVPIENYKVLNECYILRHLLFTSRYGNELSQLTDFAFMSNLLSLTVDTCILHKQEYLQPVSQYATQLQHLHIIGSWGNLATVYDTVTQTSLSTLKDAVFKHTLQTLVLVHIHEHDSAVDTIQHFKNLRKLVLSNTRISSAGIMKLCSTLQQLHTLHCIHPTSAYKQTDGTVSIEAAIWSHDTIQQLLPHISNVNHLYLTVESTYAQRLHKQKHTIFDNITELRRIDLHHYIPTATKCKQHNMTYLRRYNATKFDITTEFKSTQSIEVTHTHPFKMINNQPVEDIDRIELQLAI